MFGTVSGALQEVDWIFVIRVVAAVLPIWIFGAVVGLLIPRPRWMSKAAMASASISISPYLRQVMLWLHAGMIAREIWKYCRHLLKVAKPSASDAVAQQLGKAATPEPEVEENRGWYISRSDLEIFRDRVEREAPVPGSGSWEVICDKKTDDLEYSASRRSLPDGTTEYRSTTISYDATAPEFMDFFLLDPLRQEWDNLITHTEVVENGDFSSRDQVVRWVRSFPFAFLTDREYVLGRRVFRVNDSLYGITKSVEHPSAPINSIIRIQHYHSMWRCRTIPSPRGNGELACETILLHCENMNIPERLARFAVRHGMWGFVKKMGPCSREFIKERRARVDSFEADPKAFGWEAAQDQKTAGLPRKRRDPLSLASHGRSSARSSFSDLVSIGENDEVAGNMGGIRRSHSTGRFADGPPRKARKPSMSDEEPGNRRALADGRS